MDAETAKITVEMLDDYLSHTCQDYGERDHEAMMTAVKALEQEPKSVIYSGDGYADGYMVYDMAECPSCGYIYDEDDKDWKEPFCPHCGQPLNWEV